MLHHFTNVCHILYILPHQKPSNDAQSLLLRPPSSRWVSQGRRRGLGGDAGGAGGPAAAGLDDPKGRGLAVFLAESRKLKFWSSVFVLFVYKKKVD